MEITAIATQTVASNGNVLFTETVVPGNCSILHREGSGIVTLRGLTQQCRARFRVTFNGNISVPTEETPGVISLVASINGEPLQSTKMIATPAAVLEPFSVGASTFVDVPTGCCLQLSIKNDTANAIAVANADLIVERVA